MPPVLTLDALSVSFRNERNEQAPVLLDVSLTLNPGEMLALVGESGSGKTTLGLSLLRLLPRGATLSGHILFSSGSGVVDLAAVSSRAMRRYRGKSIAMMFQEPAAALDPQMKVGQQVAGCLRIHGTGSRRDSWRAAVELLDAVGLPEAERRARDYPHQLSGGMRQRVAMAMSLIQKPSVLIADEPTTALDLRLQEQNLQLLRDQADRRGLAVLLVTHDLMLAAQWCDRIAVLYAGRLVEMGGRREILASARHPYTRALLALSPALDRTAGRIPTLPGDAASAAAFERSCAFAPRCSRRQEKCEMALPDWSGEEGSHGVRCFFPESAAFAAGGRA